jgi:hypothetical protein
MKRLIVREESQGRTTIVEAKSIYEKGIGDWVAEVDEAEMHRACDDLCRGIENCSCENLHIQADQDDDGKEYRVVIS